MSKKQIITILKSFQNSPASSKLRRNYFRNFGKKMAYRTTKSENPEVTFNMVEKVWHEHINKHG